MKNKEIIIKIATEIYGEDAIKKMIENGEDIPLHTAKGWKEQGPYRIKKSEHGIKTNLWKKGKNGNFYKVKTFLYTIDQIERIIE